MSEDVLIVYELKVLYDWALLVLLNYDMQMALRAYFEDLL